VVGASQPLGAGAAQAAPTAPHATPRLDRGKSSGPERFWKRWPMRLALGASLVVSALAHCAVVPLEVPRGFEVNDVDGEAAIPVDVLAADEAPPPPPPPPPEPTAPPPSPEGEKPSPPPPRHLDAGAPNDAAVDARPDAPSDAGAADGSEVATDAGPGPVASGPKDPQAILGAAGSVQADVVLVMVVVNAEVIRKNPVGARMGYLLKGIPQWEDFMSGTEIDPVRDTDWVMISGPSLVNTTRDVVMIHYAATDAAVDKAIAIVSRKYDRGGPYDAGVPGVKASLAHADRGERVLLRPQPHVLAVVPPSVAEKVAKQLVAAKVPAHIRPGEAAYIRVVNPHHPMPEIPASITEARLRVVPRADEGADVFIDGDTKDGSEAEEAAEELKTIIQRRNNFLVASLTHGLLDHVEVRAEGNGVHVHLAASRDQIEAIVELVGDFFGVRPSGPVGPAVPPTPSGRP
jgi:hypothetical protein